MNDYETCLAFLFFVGIIAWICAEVTFYKSEK
jgi:hypothetical protein